MMKLMHPALRAGLSLLGAGLLAASAQAAPVSALSYSMKNGGGQASGGTYNYWDAGYTGSGSTTTDGAFLSGGLGKLTDGVIATQRWDAVSNIAGTGEYVGWVAFAQPLPLITFNFAAGTVIDEIDIYFDNSQFGGVFAPAGILIDGFAVTWTAAVGNGIKVAFTGLGLTGTSHTVQFNQHPSTWTFVSEITFDGSSSGVGTVPEPGSLALAGLALAGLAATRRRPAQG